MSHLVELKIVFLTLKKEVMSTLVKCS